MYYRIKIQLKQLVTDLDRLISFNDTVSQKMSEVKEDTYFLNLTMVRKKELHALAICTIDFDLKYSFEAELKEFLDRCELAYESYNLTKISLVDMRRAIKVLENSSTSKNTTTKILADSDNIAIWLPNFSHESFDIRDEIITEKYVLPKSITLRSAFKQEVERIKAKTCEGIMGNPVHYIIQACLYPDARNATCCLVNTLHQNQRLIYNHLVEINFNMRSNRHRFMEDVETDNYSIKSVATQLGQGGAMMIVFNDDSFSQLSKKETDEAIDVLTQDILTTRHNTLYILVTDDAEGKIMTRVKEKLTKISFVTIQESALNYENALEQMSKNLEDAHMNPSLAVELLEKDKALYTPNEIALSFANWYDDYLRNNAYPQYAHIKPFEVAVIEQVQGKAYDELQALIGLEDAKHLIDDFIAAHQASRFYEKQGMIIPNISKHMIFLGAPGTAKTTVARLLGRIMKDNDLLSIGDFIEVTRADLVERYVGWTARNVKKFFAQAKGSILFIDEAYSLMDGSREKSFGDEAINTIVSEMENARDDIMVIFAGYPKEMTEFIARNPGLKSRINFTLDFKDYTLKELLDIAQFMTTLKGFNLSEAAMKRIAKLIIPAISKPDYGNARFVRNLVDLAIVRHGSRLFKKGFENLSDLEIKQLTEEDFPVPIMDVTSDREALRSRKLN